MGGGDENAPQVAPLDVHACAAAFSQSVLLVAESAQLRAPLGVALWFLPTCTPVVAWSVRSTQHDQPSRAGAVRVTVVRTLTRWRRWPLPMTPWR